MYSNGSGVLPGLFGWPTGSTAGTSIRVPVAGLYARRPGPTVSGALKIWSALLWLYSTSAKASTLSLKR